MHHILMYTDHDVHIKTNVLLSHTTIQKDNIRTHELYILTAGDAWDGDWPSDGVGMEGGSRTLEAFTVDRPNGLS